MTVAVLSFVISRRIINYYKLKFISIKGTSLSKRNIPFLLCDIILLLYKALDITWRCFHCFFIVLLINKRAFETAGGICFSLSSKFVAQ